LAITIADIANEAGVSRATVSGVLNNNPNVAEKTREKVLKIIEKYNFRPNEIARALALQQTGLVGLVVKDISNPVYSKMSIGVSRVCEQAGYNVLIGNTHTEIEREIDYLHLLVRRRVDGLIILPLQQDADLHTYTDILQEDLPLVLLADLPGVQADLVRSDDEQGALLGVNHLLECRCKKPLYLAGPESFLASQRRKKGFLRALADNKISHVPEQIVYAGWRLEDGYNAGKKLIHSSYGLPDGIFCYNDSVAIGLIRALVEEGIKIPEQVRIVGFDDAGVAAFLETSLTTIAQQAEEIGKRAAGLLIDRIQFKGETWERQQHYLPTHLVVRETTGCYPKGSLVSL